MRLDEEFLLFAEPGVSSPHTQKSAVGPYTCADFSPSSECVLVLNYLHSVFPEAIGAISLLWYGGAYPWVQTAAARSVPGDVQVSKQWNERRHLWVEGVGGFINSLHSLPGALIGPRLRSGMLSHLSSARLSYFEIKRCCMSSAG
jgi:hypothetical protein